MSFPIITAEEAASHIKNGDTVGLSGFTPHPAFCKDTFDAVAAHAVKEHEAGRPYKMLKPFHRCVDKPARRRSAVARANAVERRAPYQNIPDMRARIKLARHPLF